jgi:hypothetical protein
MFFLQALGISKQQPPFDYFYTTLDDSAEYGFNIREANQIKEAIQSMVLSAEVCPVYPGADEVHLTMLAKLCVNTELSSISHGPTSSKTRKNTQIEPFGLPSVTLAVVFRDPSTIQIIPGYEGQPMIDTLKQQIAAAGGVMVDISDIVHSGRVVKNNDLSGYDAFLLINNFSED